MRLLTYNIHKGVGGRDRRYRIERIIAAIEGENPDLICLQEVTRDARRSRRHDQPHILAEYFKSSASLYQMNVHYQRGGYGNLFLSRWSLAEKHRISLRFGNKKPRGAQLAIVESPEGPLVLANCHLGLAEQERHWQVRRLLSHHFCRSLADLPMVVAGDLNDWRNTLELGPFAEYGFRQITHPPSRFRTFPAYMSVGSLDKVFFRGPLRERHSRVVRTQLAKRASDHLPVIVDFHLC